MSIKSEPMEFQLGELEHSTAIPLHLVPNSIVTDDRAAMQTSHDSLFSSQTFTGMSQNVPTTDDILRTDRLVSERVVSVSKQNNFNNSHSVKVYSSSKIRRPNFTIARGEIELNSKFLPKKYRCGFCVYKTSYKSDLNRHLRRHTQDANFHCEECNMPFKTEGLVYHHKRTAHGEGLASVQRNYECHMCPYGTPFEVRYNRHMQLHSTCRYVCNVCNKPFSIETMLKQHLETLHGIVNPFDRYDSHSREIRNIQNAKCSFQVSPVSSPNSFPSSSFKTNMDNLSNGSSNYSSEPNLNNDIASIGNEVIENCVQQTLSLHHTLPKTGGTSSVGNNSFDDVSKTNESDGMPIVNVSPNPAFLTSSRVDMTLKEGDTRNMLSKPGLVQGQSISPAVYSNKSEFPSDLLEISDALNTCVKPITDNDHKSLAIKSASRIKQYCCERCDLVFTTLDGILNHKPSCTTINFRRVKACTLCPFQTINQHVFERHFEKHSHAPYCCEMCNRPFIAVANLMKHKRELHRNIPKRKTAFSRPLKNSIPLPCTRSKAQLSRDACYSVSKQKTRNVELQSQGIHSLNRPYIIRQTADVIDYDDGVPNLPSNPVKKETEIRVTSEPPEFGRFAKLVSDFDEFASRPYACALCFFRTNDMAELTVHVENHLTGCNRTPIPETARFIQKYNPTIQSHNRGIKTSRGASRHLQREATKTSSPVNDNHITELRGSCDGTRNNSINDPETQWEPGKNHPSNKNNCEKEIKPGVKLVRRQHQKSTLVFVKRRKQSNCRAFKYKSSLPGRMSFRCGTCEKSFSMRVILMRHESKIHGCCATVGDIKRL